MVTPITKTVNDDAMAALANEHGWEFKAERLRVALAMALLDLEQSQCALMACGERARKAVNEAQLLKDLVRDMGAYRTTSLAYAAVGGGHVLNMPPEVWMRFSAALQRMDVEKAGQS